MIKSENRNALNLGVGMFIILAIIYGTSPPARDNMLTYMVMSIASVIVYSIAYYQSTLFGVGKKNLVKSLLWAIIVSIGFYLATSLIPAFSIGLPLVPNSVADSLKFWIIVIIAPIAEELFFRGALLGYIRNYNPSEKKIQTFLIIQAVLFAFAHLGAYVTGFYNYSNITQGLSAINANLSVFISAGLFGYIAGLFVSRVKNLYGSMLFHAIINFILFSKAYAIVVF